MFDDNLRKRFDNRCILTRIVNFDIMLVHSYTAVLAFAIMIGIYTLIFRKLYHQVNEFCYEVAFSALITLIVFSGKRAENWTHQIALPKRQKRKWLRLLL